MPSDRIGRQGKRVDVRRVRVNGKVLMKNDKERLRSYIDTHRVSAIIEGGGWSNVTLDLLETFKKVPVIGFASAAELKSKEISKLFLPFLYG